MSDLQGYQITFPGGTQNLTAMPRMRVEGRFIDSSTGQLIPNGDFTGANSFDLLPEIKLRTAAQQLKLAEVIGPMLLAMKAGLDG